MTDFEKLIDATKLIQSPAYQEYTRGMLTNVVPKYFRHIPASSSGKYHPKSSLGEGGLVRHTLATVYFVNEISKLEYLRFTPKERDQLLVASFLHDSFKSGETGETGHTVKDHAKIIADKIEEPTISDLVLRHMGQWGFNKPNNMMSFVLHLADYMASRRPVEVDLELAFK